MRFAVICFGKIRQALAKPFASMRFRTMTRQRHSALFAATWGALHMS